MTAITIGGAAGAGAPEIGVRLATSLRMDYVSRLALRTLAKKLNATPEAVWMKENHHCGFWERTGHNLARAFEAMGEYGVTDDSLGFPSMAQDPFFGMPPVVPRDRSDELRTEHQDIPDDDYTTELTRVNRGFARKGDVVLVKRAGCSTLQDEEDVIHIGLFASRDHRVARLSNRLNTSSIEAADVLKKWEKRRSAIFNHVNGSNPHDRELYDIIIRTDAADETHIVPFIQNELMQRGVLSESVQARLRSGVLGTN
ncbi:MAG: cytidylate kinase family protein [Acidimicrobiales bacterium]|nr:cytidylate kinase family protein [Acidimicrobiales bacterium]